MVKLMIEGHGSRGRRRSLYTAPILVLLACAAGADDSAQPAGAFHDNAVPGSATVPGPQSGAGAGAAKVPPPSRYAPARFAGRAGVFYETVWGIDSISVRLVESGELVRFTYRVLDPAKAKLLNDKRAEATLEDPKAGVSLVVPVMEKVGQLRQTSDQQAGRSYWMTFSNKGRYVARGDRVDVVIGAFRANNLVVD